MDNMQNRFEGILLRSLQEELFALYIIYTLWLLIMGADPRLKNTKIINAPQDVEVAFLFTIKSNKELLKQLDNCLYAISFLFDSILQPSSTHNLIVTSSGIKIQTEAKGLIDLFSINLAVLMTNNLKIKANGNVENNKLKKCKTCGQLFWPTHGQQKYCPLHNRKTVSVK